MIAISGWSPKKLTELADYINGYAFKPDDWGKEGLPIVRIEQLKNPDAPADYFDGKLPPSNIIDDGDLIFSWSASLFLRIWRHGRAALNQHLFKVLEHADIDRVFLKELIEFNLPALIAASHGSTMQHITRKELARFQALIPDSKLEQAKIGEILSIVNQAAERTQGLIVKQQRIRSGLMQMLLARGIDENGEVRTECTHTFIDSPLGQIPKGWKIRSMSSVFAKPPKNGISPVESDVWNGSYVLGLGCLTADGFNPKQLKFAPPTTAPMQAAILRPGDFLISRSNTRALVGLVGIFKEVNEPCIYPDLMVRLAFSSEVSSEYMEQVFMAPLVRRQIENAAMGTSGSMVKINGAAIKGFQFLKPPLEEQYRILSILQGMNGNIRNLAQTLDKLRSLKTSLMQDLLTGRRRVIPLLDSQSEPERLYA